jgi:hypothetical protein
MAAALSHAIAKHAAPAYPQEAATKTGEQIETAVVPGICLYQAGFSFSYLSRFPGADTQ